MGLTCSKHEPEEAVPKSKKKKEFLDPFMHDLMLRSIEYTSGTIPAAATTTGQTHLLYSKKHDSVKQRTTLHYPTRLVVRRRPVRLSEEGMSGTHIYALRFPPEQTLKDQEQCPDRITTPVPLSPRVKEVKKLEKDVDSLFHRSTMMAPPKHKVMDWTTVSEQHSIYVADVGLTSADCDLLIQTTEQVCRGQYAAYTYAKQTLGCREFPVLAHAVQDTVHSLVHAIAEFSNNDKLWLDDREPHMVKYDVTKKERQKLDMHTDKSEWTFLISLSTGCGLDYEGGGTYFEALDATVHVQKGQALIFPGKLRHCGQRITRGLRFLLVGFLVDKTGKVEASKESDAAAFAGHYLANIP